MLNHPFATWALASTVAGVSGAALGAEDDLVRQLQGEIADLRAEVAQLRASNEPSWLTEQRANEIRALVHDVLADADTRASLLQTGANAGYDGGFFIQSADGAFLLKLNGQLQVRYIWNRRDNSGGDDNQQGFVVRRAKLKGKGHIGSPKIEYSFGFAGDRGLTEFVDDVDFGDDTIDTGDFNGVVVEDYEMAYTYDNGLKVRLGRFKTPFARENLVSSSRQLAVERSAVHETFRIDRSEGLEVSMSGDQFRWAAMVNDGRTADGTDFNQDDSDFAVTARMDLRLAGEWNQWKDFSSWEGSPDSLLLGAAVHYEVGTTGTTDDNDNFLNWTVDGGWKTNGLGLYAAFYGSHEDNESAPDYDDYGLEVMVGYQIIPDKVEPYVRYELVMPDGSRPGDDGDDVSILTAGVNVYHHKQTAKFTFDVVYAIDPLRGIVNRSSGLGLQTDAPDEDGQIAVRAQYQLVF